MNSHSRRAVGLWAPKRVGTERFTRNNLLVARRAPETGFLGSLTYGLVELMQINAEAPKWVELNGNAYQRLRLRFAIASIDI